MKEQELSLDSISLSGALRQIGLNWWVVVCLALAVFLGATGLGTLVYSPEYTATSTLVIRVKNTTTDSTYSSLTQTSQMASVYSEVFQSDALANRIAQSVGEEVEGIITCTPVEETNLLNLEVTSPTPREAFLFIHAALENYTEVADYVFSNAMLEILQEPTVPEEPSNESFLIKYRIPLTVLAAVGAAFLITLTYLMRNTVKVSAKASSLLDGKVLGVIPFEYKQTQSGKCTRKHKGVPALLLTSSLVSMNFAEAERRMATRLEAHLQKKKFQVVLVDSVAENEGKSTVSANIAIALAERGKKVALVDADLRKPAQWRIFDEQNVKRASFSDAVMGKAQLEDVLVQNPRSNLWELFQFKAVKNPAAVFNSPNLPALINTLRSQMDYVVIDSAPVAAAADAELLMRHADTTVLVVRQDVSDVRVINDTVDLVWKSTGDFSGFVLNSFRE